MDKLDFQTVSEILEADYRIQTLSGCGIFSSANAGHPLFQSAVIELLIYAADLTAKAKRINCRIDFQEDVTLPGGRHIKDVTDLITEARNAACHVNSGTHVLDKTKRIVAKFGCVFGTGKFISSTTPELLSEKDDDIAFFFGNIRLYYRSHILRASLEAISALMQRMDPSDRRRFETVSDAIRKYSFKIDQ